MTNPPFRPAGLIGDKNSGKAREALIEAFKRLPSNVNRTLHHQPVDLPAEVESGGNDETGDALARVKMLMLKFLTRKQNVHPNQSDGFNTTNTSADNESSNEGSTTSVK